MKDPILELCDRIGETSFALPCHLRHGHLEKIYETGLTHRLRQQGLLALQPHPLKVHDEDGTLLGEYSADLFIDHCLIVELKAVRALCDEHVAQLLGYLRASRIEHGLLRNFGAPKTEIRRFVLSEASAD